MTQGIRADMTQEVSDIETRIRNVLYQHARLGHDITSVRPDDDLYQLGLTSHASVNVMLALEGEFDVEFPDHMLRRDVFASVASIHTALHELTC
jgi:acyl carrier protein